MKYVQQYPPDLNKMRHDIQNVVELLKMASREIQEPNVHYAMTSEIMAAIRKAMTAQYHDTRDADELILIQLNMDTEKAGIRFGVPDWCPPALSGGKDKTPPDNA